MHRPSWQVSASVQKLPSSHVVPSARFALTQPEAGSQLSAVHWLESSQLGGGPPMQKPLTQESAVVQALKSSQAVPSNTGVLAHPVRASQMSTVHWLPSLQSRTGPVVQAPS